MKNATMADLAWLAGIIDGEGSIFVMRNTRTDRERTFNYVMRICVQSTDDIMARECLNITGEGYTFPVYEKRENQQNSLKWQVNGKKAVRVLKALLPYLKVKKDQAESAISFQETTKKHWKQMTEEDYKQQERFYFELKSLKKSNAVKHAKGVYLTEEEIPLQLNY